MEKPDDFEIIQEFLYSNFLLDDLIGKQKMTNVKEKWNT